MLRGLRRGGLKCPADVSVTGYNDMPFAEHFSPPLTTLRIPLTEMGNQAACLRRGSSSGELPGLIAVHLFLELHSGLHAILADFLEHYLPYGVVQ